MRHEVTTAASFSDWNREEGCFEVDTSRPLTLFGALRIAQYFAYAWLCDRNYAAEKLAANRVDIVWHLSCFIWRVSSGKLEKIGDFVETEEPLSWGSFSEPDPALPKEAPGLLLSTSRNMSDEECLLVARNFLHLWLHDRESDKPHNICRPRHQFTYGLAQLFGDISCDRPLSVRSDLDAVEPFDIQQIMSAICCAQ